MNAYLSHVHHFDFLPYQVQAIRQHLPWISEIVVVQGPFHCGFFDGKCRLTAAGGKMLGVPVITWDTPLMGGAFNRQIEIFRQLLARGPALLLQGDCLPIADLTQEQLLSGHAAAGRAQIINGKLSLDWSWLLSLTTLEAAVQDFQVWASRVDNEELHTEYCEPGFLHLDKVSQGVLIPEKIDLLQARFGAMPPPLMESACPGVT